MKRILVIDTYSGMGGGQKAAFAILNGLKNDFIFEAAMPEGEFAQKYRDLGVKVHNLPKHGMLRQVFFCKQLIEKQKPDIIHVHGLRAGAVVRFALAFSRFRPRIFYTVHGFHYAYRPFLTRHFFIFMEKVLNRWTDNLIVVSREEERLVRKSHIIRPEKISLIRNGIDFSAIEKRDEIEVASDIRKRFSLPSETVFSFIARFEEPKNPSPIFHAMKKLLIEGHSVKLWMIGKGSWQKVWKEEVTRLGIEKAVIWMGEVPDARPCILASDAIVFSSRHEGLPLVPLEASALAKPVITNDLPSLREIIPVDLQDKLLCRKDEDFVRIMRRMILDADFRKEAGEELSQFVKQEFEEQRMTDAYKKLFSEPRILHSVKLYAPWIGGVEAVAQDLAENVPHVKSSVLTCMPKGRGRGEMMNDIPLHRAFSFGVKWGMPLAPFYPLALRRFARSNDIVDLHLPFPLADLGVCLLPNKKIIVVHYHADIVRQKFLNPILRPLMRHTLKRAKAIIVSSPNLAQTSKLLQPFQKKVQIIPFGVKSLVDGSSIKMDSSSRRNDKMNEYKHQYGDYFLYVGRFGYYKGLLTLIEAMRNVSAPLILAGDGPLKAKMLEAIRKNKLQDRITLLPHISNEEKRALMASAIGFILPSLYRSEAFGLVLLEAMQEGIPCISTELGTGTSFVNLHEKTGLVVPPFDPTALAKAMNRFIRFPELRQSWGEAACKRVENDFSHTAMLEKTHDLYDNIGRRQ